MKNGLFSNPSRRAFLATCSSAALMGSSLPGGAFRQARLTFPFKKTDQVLLPRGPAGSFDSTHAKYPCVLKVRDEWWMWYNGRSNDSFTGAVGLATSSDGLQWTKSNDGKPVLGPGVAGKFDDKVVLHPAVVRDESGRLHLWYNGVGPQSDFHVGHATSRDGITWRRENGGDPVLSAAPSPSRPEVYVYNVNVLLEAGVYRMWYSSAQKLLDTGRYAPGGSAIVYAESEDGTHWERDPVNTLVSGKSGSDDAYACFAPHVVRRDRELWMYYSMGSVYQRYQVGLARGPVSSPAE